MTTKKDTEQDRIIRENSARIARNEESIKRQTEALEKIRDHFYPRRTLWKRSVTVCAKVCCAIFAYLGVAETVDWLWNVRESDALAANYAKVARRLCLAEGDVPGAVTCLEKAVEFDSKESEYALTLSFLKGMALVATCLDNERPPTAAEQAQINAALAEAAVLRELQPENPMPYILIAQGRSLGGERAAAIAAVEQAVRCAPEQAFVRVSACAINYFAGRVAEARAHLAEAERLNATLPLVLAWKGTLALSVDRDASAARIHFEELVRRSPRLSLGHMNLGRAILAQKAPDYGAARAAFARALALNANLKGAMRGMAQAFACENKSILARLWLDRLLALDGNDLPALVDRARLAVQTGEPAAAVTDLTAALALAPFRADLYRLRADACEKAGDAAQAKRDRATAAALAAEEGRSVRSPSSAEGG